MCPLRLAPLLLVAAACASARPSDPPLVLRDVTVVDGTGAPARENQTVVILDGRIVALGPRDEVSLPRGASVRELAGHSVIPGLVDLHVHLPTDRATQAAILAQLLRYGVTTILNPGARPGAGVEVRDRVLRGELLGPRVLSAGRIIDGDPLETELTEWSAVVGDEAAVRAEVRAQAAAGVDWIKLYRNLSPALVAAAVDEAHAHGLPVALHAGATTWTEGARLGVDMLVHSGWGTPMDELVDLPDVASATDEEWYRAYADAPAGAPFAVLCGALLAGGVTVVPTLSISLASGLGFDVRHLPEFRTDLAPDAELEGWWGAGWRERHPQTGELEPEEERLLETVYFPGLLDILRAYHGRGVALGVGTDVGNSWITPGFAYHHELELYQRAGIPPLEVLRAATRNGAEALGLLDDVGTLEVGKRADLVVLRADPARDVRAAREIESVYLAGRRVAGALTIPPARPRAMRDASLRQQRAPRSGAAGPRS
jgi:imidazolonepropionase-like amidohydrolase